MDQQRRTAALRERMAERESLQPSALLISRRRSVLSFSFSSGPSSRGRTERGGSEGPCITASYPQQKGESEARLLYRRPIAMHQIACQRTLDVSRVLAMDSKRSNEASTWSVYWLLVGCGLQALAQGLEAMASWSARRLRRGEEGLQAMVDGGRFCVLRSAFCRRGAQASSCATR